jgi:hypothetical protein
LTVTAESAGAYSLPQEFLDFRAGTQPLVGRVTVTMAPDKEHRTA